MNPMSLPQTQKRTMTMIKKIFSGLIFVAALTACTDDYKDWAPIPTTPQPETVAFGDGSVTEMSVIDLNAVTDENVQVCSINAPTASDAAYTPYYTITIGDETYSIDASGTMSAAELQTIVADNFGRRPVQREIEATVSMWLSNGKTAVKTATSAPFKVRVIPQAPEVEQAYYVTGSINGWDNTNTSYKLTNDGLLSRVWVATGRSVSLQAAKKASSFMIMQVATSSFLLLKALCSTTSSSTCSIRPGRQPRCSSTSKRPTTSLVASMAGTTTIPATSSPTTDAILMRTRHSPAASPLLRMVRTLSSR